MFYLGRGGGEKGWSKISSRLTHTPLFFTQGYARKNKGRRGRSKQTKKIINQFGRKSDPAIILVSNKWCKRSQAWVRRGLVWVSSRHTSLPSGGGEGVADTLDPPSRSAAESLWTYSPLTSDWLSRVGVGSLTDWLHDAFRWQKTFTERKMWSICSDGKTKESKNYW